MQTFTCPQCGGQTDYDPNGVGQEMHLEEQGGQTSWCVYCRVRCAHCGHEESVLLDRDPLP